MQLIKYISAVFLSASILLSSMGFTVSKHYCMGMLKNVSYYSTAEKCSFEKLSCESEDEQVYSNFSCCYDQTLAIPGISIVKTDEKKVNLFPSFSISETLLSKSDLNFLTEFQIRDFEKFAPPEHSPYQRNIIIEIQSFLI